MNPLEELWQQGKLSKRPQKVDLEKERRARIKQVGDYNAELLSRQKKPEELIVPFLFNVQMRIGSVVYDFSERNGEAPINLIDGVGFYRPLDLKKGDLIHAYLLFGKFEEMKAEGGLAYVTDKKPIPVPFYGAKESLPHVLVERMPESIESALAIDVLQNGKAISRDLDYNLISNYGSSLKDYFEEKNRELLETIGGRVK